MACICISDLHLFVWYGMEPYPNALRLSRHYPYTLPLGAILGNRQTVSSLVTFKN